MRLPAIDKVCEELRRRLHQVHEQGYPWHEIAEAIGISRYALQLFVQARNDSYTTGFLLQIEQWLVARRRTWTRKGTSYAAR